MATPPRAPRTPRTPRAGRVAASPFSGKTLGRCRIGRPLGRGATASVFHADYLPLKREVAVKILRPDAAAAPEVRTRFIEEARSLAKLDHPHVVRVFDVVEDGGYLLIIMDFVPGKSLLESIEEEGAFDPETAVDVARQLALALDHAHAARILHRDVKPGNVILREDGTAVLVDFGNADVVGKAADRKGTAHYVAPEVFQGKRQDEKTDTYSLGATLFHMLTGEPPYQGQSTEAILAAHEAGKIRAPSSVNPEAGIPRELDVLVKRTMAPARGYRFAARDLAAELESVGAAIQAGPRRPRGRRGRARAVAPKPSGPPLALIGGIALVAAVGVALAAAHALDKPEEPPPVLLPPQEPGKAPGPPEETVGDGGAMNPGIDQRAATREARSAAAAKALQAALDFASQNPDRPKEAAGKFQAVAEEYAELSQGRKAKEEQKAWSDRAMSTGDRAEREKRLREEAEAREKELEAGLARVSEAIAGLRFGEALGALQQVEAPPDRRDEWRLRGERLNLLIGFPELIHEGLQGTAVPVFTVRSGLGKTEESIVGAGADGIRLEGPAGPRALAWSELKPADVVALARKVLRNAPDPRLSLAAYCWETDQKDAALMEMDVALLTDRTGTVSGRIDGLFGPEDGR